MTEAMLTNTNLQLGACGWRHDHWQGSFYPDDLPADWQLAYYSNVFNVVLVPASCWRPAQGYDCAGWLDDVHDDFCFYLELPPGLDDEAATALFIEQAGWLQPQLGGVVLPGSGNALIEDKKMLTLLQTLAESTTLFSNEPPTVVASRLMVSQATLQAAELAVVEDDLKDLRQARTLLEQFGDRTCTHRQSMIIKNAALNAADLMKFQSVAEIMGF